MAFADSTDMTARYDERTIGDLLSDDGTRVSPSVFPTNDKLNAALDATSGEIRAHLLRGQRYSQTDLDNLTGDDLEYLKDITCQGTFWRLYRRKPYQDKDQHNEARDQYKEILASLRRGDEVFAGVTDDIEAGRPKVDTVTRVQAQDWNLVADAMRPRFYNERRSYRNR